MICYINRSTVDYDVRLNKYVQACKATNTSYFVIGWDRLLNAKVIDEHEYLYKRYAPYGNGWRNLFSLIGWIFYVWFYLLLNWSKYKVIHACNIENILLIYPLKFFGKKIIFDIYDSKKINLEQKIAQKVDVLILPHQRRLNQIGIPESSLKKLMIIENVPTFDYNIKNRNCNKEKIRLSYVGTLRKKVRGIENLLQLVIDDDRFILDIAGTGDGVEFLIQKAMKKCNRIIFHGKVLYSEALEIMKNSDFIIALYYTCIPVHKYASPNKFYESLYLGRPIVTSKETLVGVEVEKDNTGYIVEDTLESLKSVFDNYGTAVYMMNYNLKCKNCSNIWKTEYKNYSVNQMAGEYINLVKKLSSKQNDFTFFHK